MSIAITCTCGTTLHAAASQAGLAARCDCGALVPVPLVAVPDSPQNASTDSASVEPTEAVTAGAGVATECPPDATVESTPPPPTAPAICAACGRPVTETESVSCRGCRALHHVSCWTEREGCAVPRCANAPDTGAVQQTRAPRLRPCPVCAEMIPVEVHRCRYCGEFTDRGMRDARRMQSSNPVKTSYLAGVGLLLAGGGLLILRFLSGGTLYLFGLVPILALVTEVFALRDIRAHNGQKSGSRMAWAGIGLAALALLSWLTTLILG